MARQLTTEHLQAAFQAMAWDGWTFDAAMADPTRKAIVSWRARQICEAQAKKQANTSRRRVLAPRQTRQATRRWQQADAQHSPHYPGAAVTDLKRAAAGDRDD